MIREQKDVKIETLPSAKLLSKFDLHSFTLWKFIFLVGWSFFLFFCRLGGVLSHLKKTNGGKWRTTNCFCMSTLVTCQILLSSVRYQRTHKRPNVFVNHLRPNNDESQTSHCDIKGVSVSEVMGIENTITQVKFYWYFDSFSPLLL